MKTKTLIAAAAALTFAAEPVLAQVAALGSTQRGGTSQIGRTLAAAISENSDLQVRPQELANTADYLPLVNAGELEFGIANIVQLTYAVGGTGMSEGRPNPNLMMAATLMPFRTAYVTRRDSGIDSVADVAGKRAPVFADGALGDYVTRAYLATAGLTVDEVAGVAVPNFPRMWNSFAEGSTDVSIVVVGAANSREFDASFGIKYLSFDDGPEALAAMQEWLPQSYMATVTPESGIPGVLEPTNVAVFDYTFFAGADAPEEIVYEAVKALYENEEALLASGPFWRGFEKGGMAKEVGVDYHPGAIRFYKEAGIWPE